MNKTEYNISKYFAKKITELRKEKHLTQEELAEKLGMKRGVIAYYEASAKNPTIETVRRFADFFDVLIGELLEPKEKENPKPGPMPKFQRQLQKIKHLSPVRQRRIYKAIDVLIEE